MVGIISDRDLKKILGPKRKFVGESEGTTYTLAARKVNTIMQQGVITIGPERRVADAAAIMANKKIGVLPVLQKEKLVGIITEFDILKAFVKLSDDIANTGK